MLGRVLGQGLRRNGSLVGQFEARKQSLVAIVWVFARAHIGISVRACVRACVHACVYACACMRAGRASMRCAGVGV